MSFYQSVIDISNSVDLAPERINLEITETVIIEDNPETTRTLTKLIRKGMRLYLDDFGTGQSTLGYLQKYPLSGLKIDRSFVALIHNKRERGLV